jgi:hypothetical protein
MDDAAGQCRTAHSIGRYGLFARFDPYRATLEPLPGDHDRGIGVGRHMLGHTAPQEARYGTQAPRTDDDRVEAAFLGNPLDRRRRIASRLKELCGDSMLGEDSFRLLKLLRVDHLIVPWVDGRSTRMDGNDADDADWGLELLGELDASVQRPARGVADVANASVLDLGFVLSQVAFASVLGGGCAYLMAKSRSIYPAMFLHALVNGVVVAL